MHTTDTKTKDNIFFIIIFFKIFINSFYDSCWQQTNVIEVIYTKNARKAEKVFIDIHE